jgi:hypothetical protein
MDDDQNERRADKKIRLRKEAEERSAAHAALTPQQKLNKLNAGDFSAKKERERLQKQIGE